MLLALGVIALALPFVFGTFLPVRTEIAEDHTLRAERFEISGPTAEILQKAQRDARRVIAVGTKFSVRREGDDIEVIVTEGKVRVEDAGAQSSPAGGSADVFLTPGSIARAGEYDTCAR